MTRVYGPCSPEMSGGEGERKEAKPSKDAALCVPGFHRWETGIQLSGGNQLLLPRVHRLCGSGMWTHQMGQQLVSVPRVSGLRWEHSKAGWLNE